MRCWMGWTRCWSPKNCYRAAMHANSPRDLWAGQLLAILLFSIGCASQPLPANRGMNLRYTPREAVTPTLAGASPGSVSRVVGSAIPHDAAEPARTSDTQLRPALLAAILELSGS